MTQKIRTARTSLSVLQYRLAMVDILKIEVDRLLKEVPNAQHIDIAVIEHYDDGQVILMGGPYSGREVTDPGGPILCFPVYPDIDLASLDNYPLEGTKTAVYRRRIGEPSKYDFTGIED